MFSTKTNKQTKKTKKNNKKQHTHTHTQLSCIFCQLSIPNYFQYGATLFKSVFALIKFNLSQFTFNSSNIQCSISIRCSRPCLHTDNISMPITQKGGYLNVHIFRTWMQALACTEQCGLALLLLEYLGDFILK